MSVQIDIPWRGAELGPTLLRFQDYLVRCIDADEPIPCMPLDTRYEEIAARDAEFPGGIPAEVQQLYAEIEGFDMAGTDPYLYPLERLQWIDERWRQTDFGFRYMADLRSAWHDAQYFVFGQTCTGDELTYCVHTPRGKDGLIVMLDHEEQGPANDPEQPCNIVVIAETLAEWLERWMEFELVEYSWCTGAIKDLEPERRRLFLTDHVRLNPGMRDWHQHLAELGSA